VYQIALAGTKTNLHSFESGGDGATPLGQLYQDVQGNLYGMTYFGGGGFGCVYKVID
jgi:hypothetical protein